MHICHLKRLVLLTGVAKWCSQKAWLWAASTVCSRTMHIPFCPAGALMPFGDLHNYHPPPAPHYPDIGQPWIFSAMCMLQVSTNAHLAIMTDTALELASLLVLSSCADHLAYVAEGVLVNEDRAPQDDEDFGDGGYHESFQEYCLYARKRCALPQLSIDHWQQRHAKDLIPCSSNGFAGSSVLMQAAYQGRWQLLRCYNMLQSVRIFLRHIAKPSNLLA